MYDYWVSSPEYKQLLKEIDDRLVRNDDSVRNVIKEAHVAKQSKRARPGSPYTVS